MRPYSFFHFVKINFGSDIVLNLKKWINIQKSLIRDRLRITFLKKCLMYKILPPHLNRFAFFSKNLQHFKSKPKFERVFNRFVNDMLMIEINDAYRHIQTSQILLLKIVRLISQGLPLGMLNSFFGKQNVSLHSYLVSGSTRIDKKISWLRDKQIRKRQREIQPICYSFHGHDKFSFQTHQRTSVNANALNLTTAQTIILDPMSFSPTTSSLLETKDKWFVNLSTIQIPSEIQGLLQLGENFCLPTHNKDKVVSEFVKSVEHSIDKLPRQSQLIVRGRTMPILNELSVFPLKKLPHNAELTRAVRMTKSFLLEHPEVIFTRADKGNVTVALDRTVYVEKMSQLLSDNGTYTIIKKDPIKKVIRDLHDLLTRWKIKEYIPEGTYRRLNCTEGSLPRAYGLPKIHKNGCPLRIIVSTKDTPLHGFAEFLHKILYRALPKAKSHIVDSFQFVETLKNTQIDASFKLISLDVVSLFTNVPLDLAIESICKRWTYIERNCDIPKNEFLIAIRLVLNSTFFSFNNVCYQQTYGTPMGSPLSPIIADITLQDLEIRAIETLPFELPFYFRYVDDVVLAVPSHSLDTVLNTFNSLHPKIQFTLEEGTDNRLNFLDVTVMIRDNKIEFNWFHKPTFSGRYLNFESQHPLCHKIGTIIGLIDRAFLLSHPRFHQQNLNFAINILLDNGYPLNLIFQTLHNRLKKLTTLRVKKSDKHVNNVDERKAFFNVPYLPQFSERFRLVIRDQNVMTSYTGMNKLRSFIKVHKDKLPLMSHQNVVYKISCNDCDASYVGQTKRLLKTRINEHRAHIRKNTAQQSVISNHRLQNHEFNWDDIEILDEERILNKRLLSEMLFIKRQKNSLNAQSDLDSLQHMYLNIIEKLSKI